VVAEGFSRTVVPGRLETIPITAEDGVRQVVLDVAHNPDGVAAMTSGLVEAFAFERVIFVVAILDDKDYVGMLKELSRVPCRLIATRPGNVRSVPADQLRSVATALDLECTSIDDVEQAMDASLAEATDTDLVCVTGSHYVVGEARPYLLGSP
jgi:dihydrofolate synthase/folylpolyglutamate synthase